MDELTRYTCAEAFSGAGGVSLGLLNAGYTLLLGFDNDPICAETIFLNRRYLQHPVMTAGIEDMLDGRLLDILGLEQGELFLLAGGPPCQGFSVQRIGSDDDHRNDLVMLFVSLVQEVRPYYCLMENVPGISGKRGKRILELAIGELQRAGYWVHVAPLDAQDYGVPQRRRRIFMVGERYDLGMAAFTFPEPITPEGHRITVRQTIGHLPSPPEDGSDHSEVSLHRRDRLSALNKRRLAALQPGQGREHLPYHLLADCHRIDADLIGHRNVYGRMEWNNVAPTITARFDSFTRGKFGHPEEVRSISLREGALLQTFPVDFQFAGTKVDIARQIGNAVPPILAEVIGKRILACHESNILARRSVGAA